MTDTLDHPAEPSSALADDPGGERGARVWVVLPTYDEAENVEPMIAAILASLPEATVLVVDDGSPDGTGDLADAIAALDGRVRVRHRSQKQGLGRAYLDGFAVALAGAAETIVQMDGDFSHDPAALGALIAPIAAGDADLVIGSRYAAGGSVEDWGLGRRMISRGGSLFARIVLGLGQNDLTGGFKAWRAATLARVPFAGVPARRHPLPIGMAIRGPPARGPG